MEKDKEGERAKDEGTAKDEWTRGLVVEMYSGIHDLKITRSCDAQQPWLDTETLHPTVLDPLTAARSTVPAPFLGE